MTIDEQLACIYRSLESEEQRGSLEGLAEIAACLEARKQLKQHLDALLREVHALVRRYNHLPSLPDGPSIRWAQSVLALHNSCILVVDTDDAGASSTPLQLLLLDVTGTVRFACCLSPGYLPSKETMHALGLTAQGIEEAPSLPASWMSFVEALRGRFIVSFGLERVRRVLEESAQRYGLDLPAIIGECLQAHALRYFQSTGFTNLSTLCHASGYSLPAPPEQTALDRARGQLHLLHTMAMGRMTTRLAPSNGEALEDDLCDEERETEAKQYE